MVFSPEMKYGDSVRRKIRQNLMSIARIVLVGCACVCVGAGEAVPQSSGYELIPKKNVFRLKEPAQQLPVTQTNPPLPKVYLTGISTMMNQRLAFLRVPAAAKSGTPVAEQSMMLAEGQREGDIEVLGVDPAAGHVKIRQAGEVVDLTFEKDGVKSNPPAAMAGQPQPLANPPPGNEGQSAFQNPAGPAVQNSDAAMMPQNPAAAAPMPPALPTMPAQQDRFNLLNRRLPSR